MKGEMKMNEYMKLTREADRYRKEYPPGTRIVLMDMNDPHAPVPPGTRGTVDLVDDIGQIHMHWDNGRTLALVPQVDSFRRLTEEELASEHVDQGQTIESTDAVASTHTMEM